MDCDSIRGIFFSGLPFPTLFLLSVCLPWHAAPGLFPLSMLNTSLGARFARAVLASCGRRDLATPLFRYA